LKRAGGRTGETQQQVVITSMQSIIAKSTGRVCSQ
jgi:hypothetical protein